MSYSLLTVIYIAASALFILSLGGLSRQETARRGNLYGIIGMLLAVIATAVGMNPDRMMNITGSGFAILAAAIVPGAIIGAVLAARVAMTATLGATAGNICTITGPKVALSDIKYGDRNGLLTTTLPLVFTPNAGNDELKLACT